MTCAIGVGSLPKNMSVRSRGVDNLMGRPYNESQKFRGSDFPVQWYQTFFFFKELELCFPTKIVH